MFIDEIDAVGRARGKNPNMGANDERENTLNQLLTEMDGFGTNSGVIILAATNRADILDKALLRAGRFDRQITVDLPELKDRIEIFNVHLRNIKKDDSVDVEVMARQTAGFSGADIANVCNEAALIAARNNKKTVDRDSFMSAIDRIICGLEHSSKIISADEKRLSPSTRPDTLQCHGFWSIPTRWSKSPSCPAAWLSVRHGICPRSVRLHRCRLCSTRCV